MANPFPRPNPSESHPTNPQPGQWGSGYPQSGPAINRPGFDPPGFQSPGGNNQHGYPSSKPPKKTGLIAGLVFLGVLAVGGIVALILVLTGKDNATPTAASSPSTTFSSQPTTVSGAPGGQATPRALADFIVDAYNTGDGNKLGSTSCPSRPLAKPPVLARKFAANITGPATEQGAQITVDSGAQPVVYNFVFAKEGGSFCMVNYSRS